MWQHLPAHEVQYSMEPFVIRKSLLAIFCCIVLPTFSPVSAQSAPTVTVDPAGENTRVRLSLLDAEAERLFAKVFLIPAYQEDKPYAVVLTNSSGQPISAITIRWSITAGERIGFYYSRADTFGVQSGASIVRRSPGLSPEQRATIPLGSSYFAFSGLIARDGERVLIGPGLFVRESVARERGRPEGSSSLPEPIRSATSITVLIDTVILEDGEVLGPDTSRTVEQLKASKADIDSLLAAVRQAEQNGQDGAQVLGQIADSRPTPDGSGPSPEQRMLARRLMHSAEWKAQLEKLAAIQLPNFHR